MRTPTFYAALMASTLLLSSAFSQTQVLSVTHDPTGSQVVQVSIENGTPGALAATFLSTNLSDPIPTIFGDLELNVSFLLPLTIGVLDGNGYATVSLSLPPSFQGNLFFQSLVVDTSAGTARFTDKGITAHYPQMTGTLNFLSRARARYDADVQAAPGSNIQVVQNGAVIASASAGGGSTSVSGFINWINWRDEIAVYVDGFFIGYLEPC